jgi:urea transport system ATP-binding protein
MLSIENLNVFYGESHVLHDLSFDLAPGETVAVMGRNGMGKTTLLKALIGMIPSRSGQIRLNERELVKAKSYERVAAGFGYVPQGRMVFPYLSVEENILSGMDRFKRPVIPEYIYESFPVLWEMRSRRGGNLSGGQQQQLAIARALVSEPRVLILDEPTEGIQPSIIQDIGRTLRQLVDEMGMTVLLVEQYYDFARELADRYWVMSRGEIVAGGAGADMEAHGVRELIAV